MEYIVKIKEKEYRVEVDKERSIVKVEGKRFNVNLSKINGGGHYSVLINNRSFDVSGDYDEMIMSLKVKGDLYDLIVQDEKEYSALKLLGNEGAKAIKGEVVKSIMPGLITKIMVKKGDAVKRGTSLCIMEAMKMENEIKAGKDGQIESVHVEEGKTVNSGEKLFTID